MVYTSLLRPLLFKLDAEQAHNATYKFAQSASDSSFLKLLARTTYNYQSPRLSQNIWGLNFRNPVGLAAGFDKNGFIPEIIEALGFGYTEIGSITANPSTGNAKPRSFRLPEDKALINRMGLNNDGAKTIVKRLKNKRLSIPLGINIAKTHDPHIMGDRAVQDYEFSFMEAKKVADYITINISCPNTSEGKTFEDPLVLDDLLSILKIKADASLIPSLVKFSSDLDRKQLEDLLEVCEKHRIHGYVIANTSTDRKELYTSSKIINKIGRGGLSGQPITSKSIRMIKWTRHYTKGQKTIIGVGGVDSFESALAMLKAGADLLQVYTGLIYEGPGLIKKINKKIIDYLDTNGFDSLLQIQKDTL